MGDVVVKPNMGWVFWVRNATDISVSVMGILPKFMGLISFAKYGAENCLCHNEGIGSHQKCFSDPVQIVHW